MATVYSDQLVKSRGGRNINANEWQGKLRVIAWDFASLPAGNLADVLVCGRIRAGERVYHGREFHSALSSGGGTATGSYGTYTVAADGISLGVVDSAARFLAATSFEAAGQNGLADLQSLTIGTGVLFLATADVFLVCVNSGEAFATAGRVSGYLWVAAD